MKKIILFVVLTLGACTTMSAQDRFEKAMSSIIRGFDRYDRLEKNLKCLRDQLGYHGRVKYEKDYMYGTVEEKIGSRTVGLWTANYYVHIGELFVATYRITETGLQQVSYVPRDRYDNLWIASDVQCGKRTGLRLNIINNRERTMVWLWNGDALYKGITVRQSSLYWDKGPRYGCNGRKRW